MRRVMQLERWQEQFNELAADPQPLGPNCPRRGWEALDTVNLQVEFRCRVRCLQAVPSFLRGQFRMALVTSLEAMRAAYHSGDHTKKCRSWKLFRLTFRMLLWRQKQRGPTKAELERRVDLFHRQEWTLLLDEARHSSSSLRRKISPLTIEEEGVRRARRAEIFASRRSVEGQTSSLFASESPRHSSDIKRVPRPRTTSSPIVRGHPTGSQWLLPPERFSSRVGRRHQQASEGVVG